MKLSVLITSIVMASLLLPTVSSAQKGRLQPKDSLILSCILQQATDITPKEKRGDAQQELKLVLSSNTDTVVKASMDAVISKVQRDQEGKWEIVYYHQDYWFWISGISKVAVKPNQRVKSGQALGYNQPGEPVELLVYDFETPVDPKKYLRCNE
jgi:hypothetical protein